MIRTPRSRLLLAPVLVAAVAAPVLLLAGPAAAGQAKHRCRHHHHHHCRADRHKPARKVIHVIDDQFIKPRVKVAKGTKIVWTWSDANVNTHNVKVTKAPRHVKRFRSPSATTNFTFKQTLDRKGTYRYLCTYHVGMTGEIVVR